MYLNNRSEVIVHCKIDQDLPNRIIIFKCFTVEEPTISCKHMKCSEVVKQMFKLLNITTKKKWSGYEFFGLTKSDVLRVLISPIVECDFERDQGNINTDPTDNKIYVLKSAIQIRSRNVGETSSLKHNKSIKHRNEAIHKLVSQICIIW